MQTEELLQIRKAKGMEIAKTGKVKIKIDQKALKDGLTFLGIAIMFIVFMILLTLKS